MIVLMSLWIFVFPILLKAQDLPADQRFREGLEQQEIEFVNLAGVAVPKSVKQSFLDACLGRYDIETCEELAKAGNLLWHGNDGQGRILVLEVKSKISPLVQKDGKKIVDYDLVIKEYRANDKNVKVGSATFEVGVVNVRHCDNTQKQKPVAQSPRSIPCGSYQSVIRNGERFYLSSIPYSFVNRRHFNAIVRQTFEGGLVYTDAKYLYFKGIDPNLISTIERRYFETFQELGMSPNHEIVEADVEDIRRFRKHFQSKFGN